MEHSLEAGRRQGEEGLAGRGQLHHLTVQGRIELNYTLWPSGPKIVTVSRGVPRGNAQDAHASPLPPCASPPLPVHPSSPA